MVSGHGVLSFYIGTIRGYSDYSCPVARRYSRWMAARTVASSRETMDSFASTSFSVPPLAKTLVHRKLPSQSNWKATWECVIIGTTQEILENKAFLVFLPIH